MADFETAFVAASRIAPPELGASRVDYAEGLARAQMIIIELVAGSCAEEILFSGIASIASRS